MSTRKKKTKKVAKKKAPAKSKKKVTKKKATKKKATKKKVSRKVLGKRSRRSGHDFEREIVRTVKDEFQDREWAEGVRRSDQGHRADLPDVCGWPGLWSECQSAVKPTPVKKLEQAERDSKGRRVIPIAITHRKRTAAKRVTMRAEHFAWLIARYKRLTEKETTIPVEMSLDDFLLLYEGAAVDLDPDAENIQKKEG